MMTQREADAIQRAAWAVHMGMNALAARVLSELYRESIPSKTKAMVLLHAEGMGVADHEQFII